MFQKMSKLNSKVLTAALRMKVSSSFLVSIMIRAKDCFAVTAKNSLNNVDSFIVDLPIGRLKTECPRKGQ